MSAHLSHRRQPALGLTSQIPFSLHTQQSQTELPGLPHSIPAVNNTSPRHAGAAVADIPFTRNRSSRLKSPPSLEDIRSLASSFSFEHEKSNRGSVILTATVDVPSHQNKSPTETSSKPLIVEEPQEQDRNMNQDRSTNQDPNTSRDRHMSRERNMSRDRTMSRNSVYQPSSAHRQSSLPDSESETYEADAIPLAPLQTRGVGADNPALEPLHEEDLDPNSFDLVAPTDDHTTNYSLETRSEQLFSTEHLKIIFGDPSLLLRFTSFLSAHRPTAIPVLIYYLDAIKALKAIIYANAIAEALDEIPGYAFTEQIAKSTVNEELVRKADQAFEAMVQNDLPAYITHIYIQTVSLSITGRITGTLPPALREASEGLAEVFCLTDPSRPDNPIVFASEEFHRTTQYGMNYVIGSNCRFLQGPKTNPFSVKRIREKLEAGQEHCEVFLNYRRDGSPFMNLLMVAPLCDSRGIIRYFIGAQVDVSGLVKECSDMESLKRVAIASEHGNQPDIDDILDEASLKKDEFQDLSEMLNMQELDTVRRWGGRMHRQSQDEVPDNSNKGGNWNKPRVLIQDGMSEIGQAPMERPSGKLSGIYEHYLLVRPYPSLRILFASPSLRVPGILQSPFMARIGGSSRVREELTQALADGRGVTAKVRWVSKSDQEGRNRWIHCTPLLGSNGAIGVWMIVIVDDEKDGPTRRFRQAPPVDPKFGRNISSTQSDVESLRDFALMNGSRDMRGDNRSIRSGMYPASVARSGSPYTLRID